METLRILMTDARYEQERELRNSVLLRPVGLLDGAWEMRDAEAWHFVTIEEERVVGCLLCWPTEVAGVGQLMQMAVATDKQGCGVGRKLVDALFDEAAVLGLREVTCHARDYAVGFYERLGFEIFGEPFVEVGMEHRHMRRVVSV